MLTQNITDKAVFVLYRLIFFRYNADTNGDGFFDEQELEALFTKEVKPLHLKMCDVAVNALALTGGFCGFSWKKFTTPPMKRMIWWKWRKRGYV